MTTWRRWRRSGSMTRGWSAPPHYDTFAEFHYAYHYGDIYMPYIKQEEPLKVECQHFLDCITGATPLTSGKQGLELVRILEASSESLKGQAVRWNYAASAVVGQSEFREAAKGRHRQREWQWQRQRQWHGHGCARARQWREWCTRASEARSTPQRPWKKRLPPVRQLLKDVNSWK